MINVCMGTVNSSSMIQLVKCLGYKRKLQNGERDKYCFKGITMGNIMEFQWGLGPCWGGGGWWGLEGCNRLQ